MQEILELRVDEAFAPMLFADAEGRRLGDSVRCVRIDVKDPRLKEIGEIQSLLRTKYGKPFFYGWSLTRRHTAKELEDARLIRLIVTPIFEPAGEECGTQYDETRACNFCGAGALQSSALMLNPKGIPKGKDFAKTISNEVVVSQRVNDFFAEHGIGGAEFLAVEAPSKRSARSDNWSQMHVGDAGVDVVPPTKVGNDPFDDDPLNAYRCPNGHTLGLNLLSALSVKEGSVAGVDVQLTRQFIGVRRGLLRPERMILISQRLCRLLMSARMKGCDFEEVHVV